ASVRNTDASAVRVEQTVKAMDDIRRNVDEARQLVSDISQASLEQADGITQVNNAVAELETLTRQTAAQVSAAALAARSQEDQAGGLNSLIARFRLEEEASDSESDAGYNGGLQKTRKDHGSRTSEPDCRP